MSRNLINLLPKSRIRAFRRAYFCRLSTVALMLLAGVVAIHTVLLVPSFLYLEAEQSAREAELARLTRELSDREGSAANRELGQLAKSATHLAQLSSAPSASAAVRAALSVPRPGIRLSALAYAAPSGGAPDGKMTMSGVAESREALRSFERALSGSPGVTAVELPIGAYARETAIDFTVTLTGSFIP